MMNYGESLTYLRELTKFGFNFGLERVVELLRCLGNPHEAMTYVHIGGTNGKGSVTAMVNAMLMAAGEKPGMFTSPHLHSYRERFRIDGELISHNEVAALLSEIRPHIEGMMAAGYEQPTEFEVNTAMALTYFARAGVKIAVMEVGLGGEIDATNVISRVKVAVLNNVALEHTEYLGHTKEAICATKAGIIKKNCQVVSGITTPNLRRYLAERVALAGAKGLQLINEDFFTTAISEDETGQWFQYRDKDKLLNNLFIPLRGEHQIENAAVAVKTGLLLGLDEDNIRRGLANTEWPCRLEKVGDKPLTIIDGAHNDHGMAVLATYLERHYRDKKIVVLIGMLADKEREKAVALLGPLACEVVVTKPNSDRAGDFQMIAEFFRPYCQKVYLEEAIPAACELAEKLALDHGEEGLLLITGSLYMVADARGYLLDIESE